MLVFFTCYQLHSVMASLPHFSILQKMVEIDPGFTDSLLKLVFKYLIESKQFSVKWSLRNTDNGICDQFAKFRILELEQSHSITRILLTSKGIKKAWWITWEKLFFFASFYFCIQWSSLCTDTELELPPWCDVQLSSRRLRLCHGLCKQHSLLMFRLYKHPPYF